MWYLQWSRDSLLYAGNMAAVENLPNGNVHIYNNLGRMESDAIEVLNEEVKACQYTSTNIVFASHMSTF